MHLHMFYIYAALLNITNEEEDIGIGGKYAACL